MYIQNRSHNHPVNFNTEESLWRRLLVSDRHARRRFPLTLMDGMINQCGRGWIGRFSSNDEAKKVLLSAGYAWHASDECFLTPTH